MSERDEDIDRVFRVLCARTLQRHGKGFPSTEDEIEEFESKYTPSAEEEERLASLVARAVERAQTAMNSEAASNAPGRDGQTLKEFQAERAASARGAQTEGLSPELEEEVDRVIESDEKASGEDQPEGDAASNGKGRNR